MNKTFKLFGLLLLLTVQPGLAESGAVNGGGVGDAGSFILTKKQALNTNKKICRKMGNYLADIEITTEDFYQCEEKGRVEFCSTFPDELEPKDFIPMYISQELEITNHDELDQVLPATLAQLMTMPCDKNRTKKHQQNFGDNFIKRAALAGKPHTVFRNFIDPLCRRQVSEEACAEMIYFAKEPLGNGKQESLVDLANYLNYGASLAAGGAIAPYFMEMNNEVELDNFLTNTTISSIYNQIMGSSVRSIICRRDPENKVCY